MNIAESMQIICIINKVRPKEYILSFFNKLGEKEALNALTLIFGTQWCEREH
jgi:hypothetical protein